jgi:hypothetical protein
LYTVSIAKRLFQVAAPTYPVSEQNIIRPWHREGTYLQQVTDDSAKLTTVHITQRQHFERVKYIGKGNDNLEMTRIVNIVRDIFAS